MEQGKIIKTDGTVVVYSPQNGSDYQLDELKSIVGGYIEIINLHDGRTMVLNDEGKLFGLPYNEKATTIAHETMSIFDSDFIVGDVLVCDSELIK